MFYIFNAAPTGNILNLDFQGSIEFGRLHQKCVLTYLVVL